jgi:hypothetical protein
MAHKFTTPGLRDDKLPSGLIDQNKLLIFRLRWRLEFMVYTTSELYAFCAKRQKVNFCSVMRSHYLSVLNEELFSRGLTSWDKLGSE